MTLGVSALKRRGAPARPVAGARTHIAVSMTTRVIREAWGMNAVEGRPANGRSRCLDYDPRVPQIGVYRRGVNPTNIAAAQVLYASPGTSSVNRRFNQHVVVVKYSYLDL